MSADFPLIPQRTIVLVGPLTDDGRSWVDDQVRADVTRVGPALGVEPRGIADMLTGLSSAGLGVERV